jgi:hypothetical protein
MVSLKNIYNSLSKIIENAGLKNVENYFVNPDMGKEMVTPPPPPPLTPIEKIEFTRIDSENKRKQADLELQNQELQSKNAKLILDFETRIKELELKYNSQIDTAELKANADLDKILLSNAGKSLQISQEATDELGQQIEGINEQRPTIQTGAGSQKI